MRKRPQPNDRPAIQNERSTESSGRGVGIVLSGGGSRAAYQAGALKALAPFLASSNDKIVAVIGSSIGAVNGLVLASCLKPGVTHAVEVLESLWRERTYRTTFSGSPSMAFLRALKTAFLKYSNPGPNATSDSIFDPTPLRDRLDQVIREHGGLQPGNRHQDLRAVGVMTTIEGSERKPLLFLSAQNPIESELLTGASFQVKYVDDLTAKHGLASAALPSVLPPVELDVDNAKVRLVDGGISQNIPVDPTVRAGADKILILDISGRDFWLERYGQARDTRPDWEVPAGVETFCFRPPETFVAKNISPLGPILKRAVAGSTRDFISALGPTWPIFTVLKKKMGEELAYEVMSYVALHPDYSLALIEQGYNETVARLRNLSKISYETTENFDRWYKQI